VGSLNAELSTLKSSNYTLDAIDTYPTSVEEFKTSANEITLYPIEPEIFADRLVFTSFSHPVEHDISTNELDHTTYVKPIASKRRPGRGLKKTLSKDPRYGTSTSSWRRQSIS
jgi:hypothetical protein